MNRYGLIFWGMCALEPGIVLASETGPAESWISGPDAVSQQSSGASCSRNVRATIYRAGVQRVVVSKLEYFDAGTAEDSPTAAQYPTVTRHRCVIEYVRLHTGFRLVRAAVCNCESARAETGGADERDRYEDGTSLSLPDAVRLDQATPQRDVTPHEKQSCRLWTQSHNGLEHAGGSDFRRIVFIGVGEDIGR